MSDVLFGYAAALTPINLVAAIISVAIGITIGALPGLSAAMGVALLIPITFGMDPSTGLNYSCRSFIVELYLVVQFQLS